MQQIQGERYTFSSEVTEEDLIKYGSIVYCYIPERDHSMFGNHIFRCQEDTLIAFDKYTGNVQIGKLYSPSDNPFFLSDANSSA